VLIDVDHVGIAVADLETAVEHYRRAFGVEPAHREVVEAQGVEEVLFRVGTSYIQLLGALGPQTPVGRFLSSHGPGVHHVAYRVDDVAAALEHLRAEGVRLVDEAPSAYRDIREVMRAQRDLTAVVRELRPVLSYKGS